MTFFGDKEPKISSTRMGILTPNSSMFLLLLGGVFIGLQTWKMPTTMCVDKKKRSQF